MMSYLRRKEWGGRELPASGQMEVFPALPRMFEYQSVLYTVWVVRISSANERSGRPSPGCKLQKCNRPKPTRIAAEDARGRMSSCNAINQLVSSLALPQYTITHGQLPCKVVDEDSHLRSTELRCLWEERRAE